MANPAPLRADLPEPPPPLNAIAVEDEPLPKGYWDLVWGQFLKNKIAAFSAALIFILLGIAAWAPVIANGKPLVWHEGGQTSYPLIQYMVAPTERVSVDYFFNYIFFATIVFPPALLFGWLSARASQQRQALKKRMKWVLLATMIIAAIPFLNPSTGIHKWRLDSRDYPRLAELLEKDKGDYAVFTLIGQDPITPTRDILVPPGKQYLLGTDREGRDVAARMLHGARISLSVGFVAESIAVLIGIFFGALAGYYRGWVDVAISRLIEIIICFPTFFLILTIVAFIEDRSIFHIMVIMGLTGWTGIARLMRGEFLKLADQDFVQAARALGCSPSRLMFRHILPNAMGPVLVSAAFGVAGAILTESGLSYLGFGAPPPTPTWGEMINQGKIHMDEAWWLIVFPGLSIFLSVTIYNLAGDGLRDAMDPKMRK